MTPPAASSRRAQRPAETSDARLSLRLGEACRRLIGLVLAAIVAYLLSALAACIYLVLGFTIGRPERHQVALAACLIELTGVFAVGIVSVANPSAFPDQTVWSEFGSGYLFLPLVLPCLGLAWLKSSVSKT